jgi:hypothetical protein
VKRRLLTEAAYASTLAEIDRLLNDPDVPMQAARVWELLAEIAPCVSEQPDIVEWNWPPYSHSALARRAD